MDKELGKGRIIGYDRKEGKPKLIIELDSGIDIIPLNEQVKIILEE